MSQKNFKVTYLCQSSDSSKHNSVEFFNGYQVFWLKPSGRFAWTDQKKYSKALIQINPEIVLQRMSSNVTYEIGKYCKRYQKTFHWFCTDNIAPLTQFHIIKFKRKYHLKFNNALKYMVFYTNALIMDGIEKKELQR